MGPRWNQSPAGLQHLPSQPWVSASTHQVTQGAQGHRHKKSEQPEKDRRGCRLWARSPGQGAWDSVCHVRAVALRQAERGLAFHQQTDNDQATESGPIIKQVSGSGDTKINAAH